ncbi:hypothetical protein EUX98_g138 [Antrodiella citrinella]|uniref:Uncharacterized protein n=1 Tax=Antrodiella citrinella TaxID=2447956 RepID=A0A4S4NDB7_9APHY|nr:hypothetical protein EUX98_g138 [Antrodiella citrinella]
MKHPLLAGHGDLNSIDGLPLLGPRDEDEDSNYPSTTLTGSDISVTLHGDNDNQDSNEIAGDGLTPDKLNAQSLGIRKRTPANSRNPSEAETHELHTLLPTTGYTSGILMAPESSSSTARPDASYEELMTSETSTVRPTYTPLLGTHTPIPASVIFSRSAAPLYLSHLDNFIATLPAPSFPILEKKGAMFPPMDRLAATGKTLEDLENNNQVAPYWRNRTSIFGTLTGWVLGITGSSLVASFYSLHGLFDTIQIFALILNTINHKGQFESQWKQIILGTIPNILAFNLATNTLVSLALLLIFMIIAGTLLWLFYKKTSLCSSLGPPEGLQRVVLITGNWSLVLISFVLTILYLPLSTMAMHVLVWSDDLWVVPNPYTNATTFPPQLPPLGPSDQFRDPLDFCWTTTMERSQLNYAPVIIIISLVCVGWLTVWYPIYLRRITLRMAPIADKYTELGRARSPSEMDREYQRLLARDQNPLTFLYDDYRRGWANYESVTLFAKLTALLMTAIVNPDNCLFRTLTRNYVAIARQILLLLAMLSFFLVQCILVPFLDPVSNASEWISRLNYVLTSALSLAIALNVPGQAFLNGPLLYIIYAVTYGLSLYFSLINTGPLRREVKRLTTRIDFSIDIFSPSIDLSPTSQHTKRRIWQEAITTLMLTNPECAIPKKQQMVYAQAKNLEFPPYLYDFCGEPGERHVENLKPVGSKKPWCCGRRYQAQTTVHFRSGTFNVKRRGQHLWEHVNIGSGFDVELTYTKDVKVDGAIIGLNDDYDLTRPLAHFLALNEYLIPGPLSHLEGILWRYRQHCMTECTWKADTLTYRFLALVYNRPREPDGLAQSSIEHERDLRVRSLMLGSELAFEMSYRRLSAVATSELATWWYIFWDDLWRRNYDTISGLQKHASDFCPHYPTSIAYTPLPRAALESFLIQRGLYNKKTKWGDFFTAGFLNKLYLRMNDIVFHRSHMANIIHLGDDVDELDMEEIDAGSDGRPSTVGTGGGTDHNDSVIRARPLYRWEGILGDKLSTSKTQHVSIWSKFGVWFGITPLWRTGVPSPGLALDVRLDAATGRYVLLQDGHTVSPYTKPTSTASKLV